MIYITCGLWFGRLVRWHGGCRITIIYSNRHWRIEILKVRIRDFHWEGLAFPDSDMTLSWNGIDPDANPSVVAGNSLVVPFRTLNFFRQFSVDVLNVVSGGGKMVMTDEVTFWNMGET